MFPEYDQYEVMSQTAKRAMEEEPHRIEAWMERRKPDTGEAYTFYEALQTVIENPPSFDGYADQVMWEHEHPEPPGVIAEMKKMQDNTG